MKKKLISLSCFFFLVFYCQLLWAEAISVVIPSEAEVSGEEILLKDIASIDLAFGANDKLSEIAAKLANISLGPSPQFGQSKTLRLGQIEQKLRESGLDLSVTDWHLPQSLTITREGELLTEAKINQIIENYLSLTEPYQSGEFKILSLTFSNKPVLPPNITLEYDFVANPSSNPIYLNGNIYFKSNHKELGRLRVTAQIELNILAVVVVNNLSRGTVLDEDDLSLTMLPYNKARGALTDPKQAVGNALKTNLLAGAALKDRDLTKSIMIQRGDIVTIVAKSGGLNITAVGQAKQDGSYGETITVMNQDSKKNVAAKVVAPNMVEVVF